MSESQTTNRAMIYLVFVELIAFERFYKTYISLENVFDYRVRNNEKHFVRQSHVTLGLNI